MTDPKNLENWLHEKVGPAYDALKADQARAVSADQVRYTLAECRRQCRLVAQADNADTDLQHFMDEVLAELDGLIDAPAVGREVLPPYKGT